MYYCSYGILKYRSLKFDQIVMKAERSTSNCTFVLLTSSHMSDVTLSSVVIKYLWWTAFFCSRQQFHYILVPWPGFYSINSGIFSFVWIKSACGRASSLAKCPVRLLSPPEVRVSEPDTWLAKMVEEGIDLNHNFKKYIYLIFFF